jgi:hypothetical protein
LLRLGLNKFGLRVNDQKTKVMQLIRSGTSRTETLKTDNHAFEIVDELKYLKSAVNGKQDTEFCVSINAVLSQSTHINLKNISRVIKCRFYKTVTRPVATCSAEMWVMHKSGGKTLMKGR